MTQNNNNSNNNNSVKFEKPAGYKNINTSTAGSKPEEKESRFSFKGLFNLITKISSYSSQKSSSSSS